MSDAGLKLMTKLPEVKNAEEKAKLTKDQAAAAKKDTKDLLDRAKKLREADKENSKKIDNNYVSASVKSERKINCRAIRKKQTAQPLLMISNGNVGLLDKNEYNDNARDNEC